MLAALLKKLFKKPAYWSCHYKVKPIGSDLVIQSGTFAALGTEYDKAYSDAEKTLKDWVKYKFDTTVEIRLYKPSWLARLAK